MKSQRSFKIYGVGMVLFIVCTAVSLGGCSQVDVSGHIRYRKTVLESSAGRPANSKVYGFSYDNRTWDKEEPIPAGKGRVVLLQPGTPADQGAGFVFKINDKGDFILGTGNALAWNHPVGTCKLQFISYLTVGMGAGERRLSNSTKTEFFKITDKKTLWLLFRPGQEMMPVLISLDEKDAETILVKHKMKKFALPKDIEDDIPWLP